MSKKKKQNKNKAAYKGGIIVGSLLRPVIMFFGFIIKFILKLFSFFGLWIPLVYAAFGGLLYLVFDFNPFWLDVYGMLYLCGALACIVAAAVISIRNVVVKPARTIYQGYKHPFWKKYDEDEEDYAYIDNAEKAETVKSYKKEADLNPPEIESFKETRREKGIGEYLIPSSDFVSASVEEEEDKRRSLNLDWLPKIDSTEPESPNMRSVYSAERPKIYFSELNPDLLVHEYSDRFELYRVNGKNLIFDSVKFRGQEL